MIVSGTKHYNIIKTLDQCCSYTSNNNIDIPTKVFESLTDAFSLLYKKTS